MKMNKAIINRIGVASLAAIMAVCLMLPVFPSAAESPDDKAVDGDSGELVSRVKFTRQQFVKLTTKMLEVADMLADSEPQTAEILRTAVSQAREAFIAEDMEEVAEYLTGGINAAAAETQSKVVADLEEVLKTLTSGVIDTDQRMERIKKWEKILDEINKAIEKQKSLELSSRLKTDAKKIDKQIQDAVKKLENIISTQKDILAKTKGSAATRPATMPKDEKSEKQQKLAEQQKDLSDKTGELANDLKELAEELNAADEDSDPASRVERAAAHMSRAASQLKAGRSKSAAESQENALKELEGRKYELARLRRRIEEKKKSSLSEQASDQDKLAKETEQLAGKMGKPKDSSTPGAEGVKSAAGSMSSASGKLSGGKAGEANSDQKEALKKLVKSRDELEVAIKDEYDRMKEKVLAEVDQMLEEILEAQKEASVDTKKVYAARDAEDGYTRAEELEMLRLSKQERRLREETKKVYDLIDKEGTTSVFPAVLKDVRSDLADVAKMLNDHKPGPLTQGIQAQIERDLEDLTNSVREELAKHRRRGKSGGGGKGGGGGKSPLVSALAELKMLANMQRRINDRTVLLEKQKGGQNVSKTDLRDQHEKLSDRQEKLEKLTRDFARKIGGRVPHHKESTP